METMSEEFDPTRGARKARRGKRSGARSRLECTEEGRAEHEPSGSDLEIRLWRGKPSHDTDLSHRPRRPQAALERHGLVLPRPQGRAPARPRSTCVARRRAPCSCATQRP